MWPLLPKQYSRTVILNYTGITSDLRRLKIDGLGIGYVWFIEGTYLQRLLSTGEDALELTPSGAKGLLCFYPYILDFKTEWLGNKSFKKKNTQVIWKFNALFSLEKDIKSHHMESIWL